MPLIVRCDWSSSAGRPVLSICRLVLHLAHARHVTGHVHVKCTCSALMRGRCSCRGRSCNASVWVPTVGLARPAGSSTQRSCVMVREEGCVWCTFVHLCMCLFRGGCGCVAPLRGSPRHVKQLSCQKSDCVTRSQRCMRRVASRQPDDLARGVARTRLGHTARRRAGGNIDASRRR